MNSEKRKRGRKPKPNRQTRHISFRLNEVDSKRLLQMYEKSGKRSMSAFLAHCVLTKTANIVVVNKSAIYFVILSSSFFGQFRAIKNNYHQVFHALIRNFGEQKANSMMKIVEKPSLQLWLLMQEFEESVTKLREKCLPK